MRHRFALFVLISLLAVISLCSTHRIPELSGNVVSNQTPVIGAQVRIKGSPRVTFSDVGGHFHLPDSHGSRRIVTAAKPGFFIAGIPNARRPLTINLLPLPEDNEQYVWIDPAPNPAGAQNCGNCHAEIHAEWSASAHARGKQNRHFRNIYEGTDALNRPQKGWSLRAGHPDGVGVCTSCHAPSVEFSDAAYFDLRQVTGVSARGIHCDYCHKIADTSTDKIGLTHGRFAHNLIRPKHGQLFFGPLDDVDRGDDAYSPLYQESRYCASCHEGVVFGVHVYSTYSEWLASPARHAGKHCQSCHMAPTGRMSNFAPGKGGITRDPWTLASHRMKGADLEMLRRCLHVVTVLELDAAVGVTVRITTTDVGHRVPTGFVDRHLLLIVDPLDKDLRPLPPGVGPRLPPVAGKELADHNGEVFGKQLQDFSGRSPTPFWQAQSDALDTRLKPDTAFVSRYRFASTTKTVRVRLIYRRFWHEVAENKGWLDNEIVVYDQQVDVPGR